MTYIDFFKIHISNKDVPEIINLLEEYCLVDDPNVEEIIGIISILSKSFVAPQIKSHLEDGVCLLVDRFKDSTDVWAILKALCSRIEISSPQLLQKIEQAIHNRYSDDEHFEKTMRVLDLNKTKAHKALERYELLRHIKRGNLVHHRSGWGVGEITNVSFNGESLSIEFENSAHPINMSFVAASNTLSPLSTDSFWAQRILNAEGLMALGKESPEELLSFMLKATGPLSPTEIKDVLCEFVFPLSVWTNWWNRARSIVKKSSIISIMETPAGKMWGIASTIPRNTTSPSEPSDSAIEEIGISSMQEIETSIKAVINKSKKTTIPQELVDTVLSMLEQATDEFEQLALESFLNMANKLDTKTLMAHLRSVMQTNCLCLTATISKIPSTIATKHIVSVAVTNPHDFSAETFAELFCSKVGKPFRAAILKLSRQTPSILSSISDAVSAMSGDIGSLAEAFTWLLTHKFIPEQSASTGTIQQTLLLLEQLNKQNSNKEIRRKMLSLVKNEHYELIRNVFSQASKEDIQDTLLIASKSCVFAPNEMLLLRALASAVHPSIENKNASAHEEKVEMWTTQKGYEKAFSRLKHITENEVMHLAKEIEIARSYGDLRENSEYKAALEKRARLQREVALLSKQLNTSRIIRDEDVSTLSIGIGNIVRLIDLNTKDELEFIILGPWDTSPTEGIISFQSGIANKLWGKAVGDNVELNNVVYVVKEISAYELSKEPEPASAR